MPKPATTASYPPVGKLAPAFTLPATDGRTIKLADFRGKKIAVLHFYPRDNTPGCTKQARSFRDDDAQRYGVWQEQNRYGRLAKVFEKIKSDGHAPEVLEWIRTNLPT